MQNHNEFMTSNIQPVIDQMVKSGIIMDDQKREVVDLFTEMQRVMQSSDAYKIMELLKKTIPEKMLQMSNDMTYEDAMLLTLAVQAAHIKKAGRFFEASSMGKS